MRWKKYCIDMDMTGITRKAAAEILADIFQTEYNFQSDENCYEVKDSTDKTCCGQKTWYHERQHRKPIYEMA